jgi:hypothetical protein
MNLKTLSAIRNKSQLQDLFISQYSRPYISNEINEILKTTRPNVPPAMRLFAKNISQLEGLMFVYRNGLPDGYMLSDELKEKLLLYRELYSANTILFSKQESYL